MFNLLLYNHSLNKLQIRNNLIGVKKLKVTQGMINMIYELYLNFTICPCFFVGFCIHAKIRNSYRNNCLNIHTSYLILFHPNQID